MQTVSLEWTAATIVPVIVKTMNHVTMLVECVLVDVRMGLRTNIVIVVRNLNLYSNLANNTIHWFCLINCTIWGIIACEVGKFGKNCSLPCPQGCNGTCNHIDGSCANCKERLEGHCPKGNYKLHSIYFVLANCLCMEVSSKWVRVSFLC